MLTWMDGQTNRQKLAHLSAPAKAGVTKITQFYTCISQWQGQITLRGQNFEYN